MDGNALTLIFFANVGKCWLWNVENEITVDVVNAFGNFFSVRLTGILFLIPFSIMKKDLFRKRELSLS